MLPLIVLVGGLGTAAYAAKKRRHGMTPQRKRIFEAAFNTLSDPSKLNQLADSFEGEGLRHEADLLRKRARLRSMPNEVKKARKEAFKKALNSTNVEGILNMANAYEREGAIGSAKALRDHAQNLRKLAG